MRHFYPGSDGNCSLCSENKQGDIAHLLTQCSSLAELRRHLVSKLGHYPISDTSRNLISKVINSGDTNNMVHFFLDCSSVPDVISVTQSCGSTILEELFRFTRAWCFSVHRAKLKLQGRWTGHIWIPDLGYLNLTLYPYNVFLKKIAFFLCRNNFLFFLPNNQRAKLLPWSHPFLNLLKYTIIMAFPLNKLNFLGNFE